MGRLAGDDIHRLRPAGTHPGRSPGERLPGGWMGGRRDALDGRGDAPQAPAPIVDNGALSSLHSRTMAKRRRLSPVGPTLRDVRAEPTFSTAMKALTIRQPWASLIMAGIKDVENRGWSTGYRGQLAIQRRCAVDRSALAAHAHLLSLEVPGEVLPAGAVLGTVQLLDVVTDHQSPWAEAGSWNLDPERPGALHGPVCCRSTGVVELGTSPLSRSSHRVQIDTRKLAEVPRMVTSWVSHASASSAISRREGSRRSVRSLRRCWAPPVRYPFNDEPEASPAYHPGDNVEERFHSLRQ